MKKLAATLLAAALVIPGAAQAQTATHSDRDRYEQSDRMQPNRTQSDRMQPSPMQSNRGQIARQPAQRDERQVRAPDRQAERNQGQSHRFAQGDRFERSRADNYRRLNYREYRRLSAPPRGYVWVRSGDDALLVRLTNNIVGRIVTNLF